MSSMAPSRRGFENEELAATIWTFENGIIGTLSVSDSIVSPWSWELTSKEYPVYPTTSQSCYHIGGIKGALSVPDLKVWQHETSPDWWQPIRSETLIYEHSNPLENQLHHFAHVIRGQAAPLVSGWDGLRSLQVIEAIALSAKRGVSFDITKDFEDKGTATTIKCDDIVV